MARRLTASISLTMIGLFAPTSLLAQTASERRAGPSDTPGTSPAPAAAPAGSPAEAPEAAPAPTAPAPPAASSEPPAAPPPPPQPEPPRAAPAPPAPPAASAPQAPAPATPAAPSAPADQDLRFATVHLASDYPETWLELRNFVDSGEWYRACQAPCDKLLLVEGSEARVTAPGMTTSNEFRLEPGRGRALVKVEGGSARARSVGVTGLAIGIPVSLIGMGLLGYGIVQERDALQIGGGITLGVGATIVLGSLPLLVMGSTDVHDGRGKQIAGTPPALF